MLFSLTAILPLLCAFLSANLGTTYAAPLHTSSLTKRAADFSQSAGPHFVFSGGPGDIDPGQLSTIQTYKGTTCGQIHAVTVVGYKDGNAEAQVYDTIFYENAAAQFGHQNIVNEIKLDLTFTRVPASFEIENQFWGYQVILSYFTSVTSSGPGGMQPIVISSEHFPIAKWGQ